MTVISHENHHKSIFLWTFLVFFCRAAIQVSQRSFWIKTVTDFLLNLSLFFLSSSFKSSPSSALSSACLSSMSAIKVNRSLRDFLKGCSGLGARLVWVQREERLVCVPGLLQGGDLANGEIQLPQVRLAIFALLNTYHTCTLQSSSNTNQLIVASQCVCALQCQSAQVWFLYHLVFYFAKVL